MRARQDLPPHGLLEFGELPCVFRLCQSAAKVLPLTLQRDALGMEITQRALH
jgi:hypothetical protein